jgi:hypothetical protein
LEIIYIKHNIKTLFESDGDQRKTGKRIRMKSMYTETFWGDKVIDFKVGQKFIKLDFNKLEINFN